MLSREVPIDPAHAALLFVDVQNYNARPDGGEYAAISAAEREARYGCFFRVMQETALPMSQAMCRYSSYSCRPSPARLRGIARPA